MTTAEILKELAKRAEIEPDPVFAARLAELAKFDHLCAIGRRKSALWRQGQ